MKSLISKKRLTEEEEEEEERRTKQSLDSPQTIEANKKIDKNSSKINNIPYPALQQTGHKGSAYLSANYFLKAASA